MEQSRGLDVPLVQLECHKSSRPSEQSGCYAAKRSHGDCLRQHSVLPQQNLSVQKSLRMETVISELAAIRKGDCMFLIDLKDAFFQNPVLLELRCYLKFVIRGTACQLRPFDTNPGPHQKLPSGLNVGSLMRHLFTLLSG